MPCMLSSGCMLKCTFGQAPTPLMVLPPRPLANAMPVATMLDYVPFKNILPFGMCSNPANPMVASATAAALGVLTPMPCLPLILSPWLNTSTKVQIQGGMAIHDKSQLICSYGGQITIIQSMTPTINIQ